MTTINGKKLVNIAQMRCFGETRSVRVAHQKITANGIVIDSKAEHDR